MTEFTPERIAEAIERVSAWANFEYTTPEQIAVKSQVSTFTAGDLRLILSSYKKRGEELERAYARFASMRDAMELKLTEAKINCDGSKIGVAYAQGVIDLYDAARGALQSKEPAS